MAPAIRFPAPRIVAATATLIMAVLLSACDSGDDGSQAPVTRMQGNVFGTFYQVTLAGELDQPRVEELRSGIEGVLDEVDEQMSTYRDDSDLNRLNNADVGEWVSTPADLFHVLERSRSIGRKTDGAFDVTVGGLVNLWSFGPEARPEETPPQDELEKRLAEVGYAKLELDEDGPRVRRQADFFVDLSGVAKGYGVDRVARYLNEQGHGDFLVNIGGDMIAQGSRGPDTPWRIGIELPEDGPTSAHHALPLTDISLATSGDYRNYFEEDGQRYSHTISPKTGQPVTHSLASVSVFYPDNTTADAYATAFMVMGTEASLAFAEEHDVAVLTITAGEDDFRTEVSGEFRRLFGEDSIPET